MIFWDSSALAPLLVTEADSERRENTLAEDADIIVWYATPAELESAIARRRRQGMPAEEEAAARNRLNMLAASWFEIQPTKAVRERAIRLLRVHPLRAADAFQLAAALAACRERPAGSTLLSGDERLRHAAEREGFKVG
jgi:predicted nucleic acid-binding protein